VGGLIELGDARHRLRIAPALGGGIADAVAILNGREVPLLRPLAGVPTDALDLGSNVLVPFSNRISGGGFSFGGNFYAVAANSDISPHAIHGDGWQAVWQVLEQSATAVKLAHDGGNVGPFRYAARLRYDVGPDGILAELAIENHGPKLPFGGGFHPWFPRLARTEVQFDAIAVWAETPDHLPLQHLPLSDRPDWDFGRSRALPADWINAAFTGWSGRANIRQPELGINVTMTASPELGTAHVYSPGAEADFFCFEPVSHATDAVNQTGMPGLAVLDRGEVMTLWMRLNWKAAEVSDA